MGNTAFSGNSRNPIDPNPVRLKPEQSVRLLGLAHAKSTLSWPDVVQHQHITFRLCVDQGLPIEALYKMQPSLQEWLRISRCTVKDIDDMRPWTPDPFTHFKCTIGDLMLYKKQITAQVLARCGLTVRILRERYGLTPDLMCALQYTPKVLCVCKSIISMLTPSRIIIMLTRSR